MSDQESNDPIILGKRSRKNETDQDQTMGDAEPASKKPAVDDEDSDEDVGPMPEPTGGAVAVKKKRKGHSNLF